MSVGFGKFQKLTICVSLCVLPYAPMLTALQAQGRQIPRHDEHLTAVCVGVSKLTDYRKSFQSSIELQAVWFLTECSKVAYVIFCLSSRAEAWAVTEWAKNSPVCYSLDLFTDTLCKISDHSSPRREAARPLMALRQGKRQVSDYAIEFRTLAADSGWNSSLQFGVFLLEPVHHGSNS